MMLWDAISWNLIHDLHPGRLTWNINITQIDKEDHLNQTFISCVPSVNFQGCMDGIQWHYKFHTPTTICTRGLENLSGFDAMNVPPFPKITKTAGQNHHLKKKLVGCHV